MSGTLCRCSASTNPPSNTSNSTIDTPSTVRVEYRSANQANSGEKKT